MAGGSWTRFCGSSSKSHCPLWNCSKPGTVPAHNWAGDLQGLGRDTLGRETRRGDMTVGRGQEIPVEGNLNSHTPKPQRPHLSERVHICTRVHTHTSHTHAVPCPRLLPLPHCPPVRSLRLNHAHLKPVPPTQTRLGVLRRPSGYTWWNQRWVGPRVGAAPAGERQLGGLKVWHWAPLLRCPPPPAPSPGPSSTPR